MDDCGYHASPQGPGWKGHGRISASYWGHLRRRAGERGIPFELGIEDAWRIFREQAGICVYTGLALGFGTRRRPGNASLDRRDSSRGYEADNVQWVDKRVNMMKRALPEGEFLELCSLVADHRQPEVDRCRLRYASA